MEIVENRTSNAHREDCGCSYCECINIQSSMVSVAAPCSGVSESKETPQPSGKRSKIFEQNYQFMWILCLTGGCPLILSRSKLPSKSVTFKWKSKVTAYSIILGILRIGSVVLFYLDWGQFMLGRKYEDTIEDYCILFINILFPIAKFWEVGTIWFVARKTAKLMNAWVSFEAQFESTFGPGYSYSCNIRRWRHIFILFSIIPLTGTLIIFFLIIFFFESTTPTFSQWSLSLKTFGAFTITLLTISEDCKYSLACYTAEEAFKNLFKGIAFHVNKFQVLGHREVSAWTELLNMIRKNVELTGKTQAPNQLFVIFETVVIFTEVLFLTTKIVSGGIFKANFVITLMVGIGYFHRLICKIVAAERLSQQEQKIGDFLLSGTKAEKFDLDGKLEVQKIIGVIHQKPCKVSLNGYIVLQKCMILTILNCVVSYLVVLIQMDISFDFSDKNAKNGTSA